MVVACRCVALRRSLAKGCCAGPGLCGFIGHWAGGIATGKAGGVEGRAGRTGQAATLDTFMKISDIPQSGHLGTFITVKNRFGQFRRRYVAPANPRTPAQQRVRSQFTP